MNCVVVGGGIIGLAIADGLVARGCQVRVIDRRTTAQIASWAAGGILPPPAAHAHCDPLESLRHLSHQLYPAWCRHLESDTGVQVPLTRCGGIYLGRTLGERMALSAAAHQWTADGVRVERWTVEELRRQEPELQVPDGIGPIYFLPDEVQVRPTRLLRALRTRLEHAGVTIQPVAHTTWDFSDSSRPRLQTDLGALSADHFCIATGAWAPELLEPLGTRLAIEPRRGQIVMWRLDHVPLHRIVNEGPRYLIARDDGHLLAGSTVEDVGYDDRTTEAGVAELMQFAQGLLPGLRQIPVNQVWAGLRPWSPDGTPLLGLVPGLPQVSLAVGHFRSGIHLAPATAQLMSQLICGAPTTIDLTPYAPHH